MKGLVSCLAPMAPFRRLGLALPLKGALVPRGLHTYIRTYVHTYIRTYVHTYIQTYIYTYIHDIHTIYAFTTDTQRDRQTNAGFFFVT